MSKSTITMSDAAHALAVYASISGKSTSTEVVEQIVTAGTEEKETRVNTVITDLQRYRDAQTLVNALRACLGRFATNVEPLGYITDPERLAEFVKAVAEIEEKIAEHNAILDQPHRIKHDVLVLPIGRVLDEKSQRRLCSTVSEALIEARTMLKAGDIAGVRYWLAHRKNLAGLMPAIVGRVVQAAIVQITEQSKRLAKLIKVPMQPSAAAEQMEVDQIDDALAWVDTSINGATDSAPAFTVQ